MYSLRMIKSTFAAKNALYTATNRYLKYSAIQYDGKNDPAPLFFNNEVQLLLKSLTRVDYSRVFRKRKTGRSRLSPPEYKFMTDSELKAFQEKTQRKAEELLQIPPVVKVKEERNRVLSKDAALVGLNTNRFVFTDITFGIKDKDRIVVVREPDGNLREAEEELRKRVNQIYFPTRGRLLTAPSMFESRRLEELLNRFEYEFILDRACVQYDPDEPEYQRITSIIYQHINEHNKFDLLRSTRHFGSLVFFLAWNKNVDNLLIDLIETLNITEAENLVDLYSRVNNTKFEGSTSLDKVENFVKIESTKKGALELAIQAYKEVSKQHEELEKGIKSAHGITE